MVDGLVNHRIDQAHQGVVGLADHVGLLGLAVGCRRGEVDGQFLRCGARGGGGGWMRPGHRWGARLGLQVHAVGLGDGRPQGTGGGAQRNEPPLGQKAQLVEQHAVAGVGHEQHQRVLAGQQGQHRFALGHRTRYQRQRDRVGRQVAGVHHVFAQPAVNHMLELVLRHVAAVHQDLAHLAPHADFVLGFLGLQAVQQRAFADDAGLQQRLAQVARLSHHRMGGGDQFPQGGRIRGGKTLWRRGGKRFWRGSDWHEMAVRAKVRA